MGYVNILYIIYFVMITSMNRNSIIFSTQIIATTNTTFLNNNFKNQCKVMEDRRNCKRKKQILKHTYYGTE